MDEIIPLFPTPVMHCKQVIAPELIESFNTELAKETWFRNVHTDLLTHTEVIHPSKSPIFAKVRKQVVPKVAAFGDVLMGERLKWSVKEMWVNVLHPGGHQAVHSHANSFVSGVLYLTPSHPSSNIVFNRDGGGGLGFVFNNDHEGAEMNPYNCAKWQSETIDAGDLILFPSYMLHSVPTNQGEEKRVSLAFNAIPDQINSWGYKVKFSR